METSSSPAVLKRWISLNLRQLRKDAGRDRNEAVERLGMSRAQIGHLETAERLPSKPVLEVLLNFYGVPERLEDFHRIVEAARKGRNWWDKLKTAVPPWFDLFLGLESGATELSSFDALLVTGLLQTSDYAEHVIRGDPDLADVDVERRVALRTGRQQILSRTVEPVRLWSVMDESVLYRQVGSTEVMCGQLEHLLEMSTHPGIDLQVLPLNAGAHTAQQGGTYTLMRFPSDMVGDPGLVYHELISNGFYLEDADEIAVYERALQRLHALAGSPGESRRRIERALKEMSS